MRLSLGDLMWVVAYCGALSWCAAMVGFDNPLFWINGIVSLAMSVAFVRWSRGRRRPRWSFLVPLVVLLCSIGTIVSLALAINSVLLCGVALVCRFRPEIGLRPLVAVVMLCALLSFVAGVSAGVAERQRFELLRSIYPVESLEDRLAYECRETLSGERPAPAMSTAVATGLDRFERRLGGTDSFRAHQLRQLHNRRYERFVGALGFGVGRMIPPLGEINEFSMKDIDFDQRARSVVELQHARRWQARDEGEDGSWESEVRDLHWIGRHDFVDVKSVGAILERRTQTIGFVSHGFRYPVASSTRNPTSWRILRLELVSLLRFETPRVYVLDHLPRMDQLSADGVPTRPLDAFESAALEPLWSQEDVVITSQGDRYRMLGALRAARQCLDCHDVARGELLGAFSYELHHRDAAR